MKGSRCYKSDSLTIAKAIIKHNLEVENPCIESDSWGMVREGVGISGGYVVKHKKEIIAWGAAFHNGEFQLYVLPHARKNGVASKIIKKAEKDFKDHKFCPWDSNTLSFFKKRTRNFKTEHLPYFLKRAA